MKIKTTESSCEEACARPVRLHVRPVKQSPALRKLAKELSRPELKAVG